MITQLRLKELVTYNKSTGIFTWKVDKARAKRGDALGSKTALGYIETSIDGEKYLVHRLVWLYTYGNFPKNNIDHINGIPNDNRICNLRDVTQKQNMMNTKLQCNSTSKQRGVSYAARDSKWRSYITIDNKQVFLGQYSCKLAATIVRSFAEKKYGFTSPSLSNCL